MTIMIWMITVARKVRWHEYGETEIEHQSDSTQEGCSWYAANPKMQYLVDLFPSFFLIVFLSFY